MYFGESTIDKSGPVYIKTHPVDLLEMAAPDPDLGPLIEIPETDTVREARREARIKRQLAPFPLSEDQEEQCQNLSFLIAYWLVHLTDFRLRQFDAELITCAMRFNVLHIEEHQDFLRGLLYGNDIRPEFMVGPFGLGLGIPKEKQTLFQSLMLMPWMEFMQSDPNAALVRMCTWCGKPFYAARSDASICSATCRSNRRHAQKVSS